MVAIFTQTEEVLRARAQWVPQLLFICFVKEGTVFVYIIASVLLKAERSSSILFSTEEENRTIYGGPGRRAPTKWKFIECNFFEVC